MSRTEKPLNLAEVFKSVTRAKILRLLVFENELNITEIAKKTSQNNKNVRLHLQALVALGLLEEKRFGSITIFRFNRENPKAKALRNLVLFWES